MAWLFLKYINSYGLCYIKTTVTKFVLVSML